MIVAKSAHNQAQAQVQASSRTTLVRRLMRFCFNCSRGAALGFGIFATVNWIVPILDGGIDSNLWWIDLRTVPTWARSSGLGLISLAMFGFAWKPHFGGLFRHFSLFVFAGACLWATRDMASALNLMGQGRIGQWNIPFSTGVALFFLMLFAFKAKADTLDPKAARGSDHQVRGTLWNRVQRTIPIACGAGLFLALIPIGVMATFGKADYSRFHQPTGNDFAVIFGAGVLADGTPSLALYDRAMTGINLYREGRVSQLLFSGGPGPGAIHETEAMAQLAREHGVPEADMLFDRQGLSTWATARNTVALKRSGATGTGRVLAVTHGYHLPRVELAFQMHGLDVLTVPATETRPLQRRHYYALREVAGFWVYWARRAVESAVT